MQALVHCCHHDTGEHAADLADGREDGSALCNLQGLVPGAKNVDGAAIQARFEEALEEANNAQLSIVATGCRAHGEAGPYQQGKGQPEAWR